MKIKMFMLAALAAFATLAGCSDDENKTTGGGGTINPPVKPSEYEATFKSTSYYSTTVTIKAITENAKSQYFMAVVFETAFLEQQIPGITDNDIAKGVINYYRAEYMSQGATVADIYNVLTQQGRLHGSVTPLELDVPGLSAGTSYSVVVAGVNENLEIVANGIVAEFTTKTLPGLEEENCTFEWTVEPKSTSVTMSFTPSDKEVPYFFYALTAEEYSSECRNDPAILKELLPSFIANLAKAYQMSVSEFMEKQRMTGIITGVILAIGRIVGESAALLFTAGSFGLLPKSFADLFTKAKMPAGTLTIQLYLSATKGEFGVAFGIAVVLLLIVLGINLLTKALAKKFDVNRR